MTTEDVSTRTILRLWLPLAAQWFMMGLEGPFLAAVIARLADPTFNLAAYGVAYAIAILVESPVIMLMSASTALVTGPESLRKLRNFTHALNGLSTALLLLVLVPPVFRGIVDVVLGLPAPVSELIWGALWLLLPWPAAIGYRRFLHGLLIRAGRTRRVAYGTLIRLASMGMIALLLAGTNLPGVWVGAAALSAGVLAEALAARFMAADVVRELAYGAVPLPRVSAHSEPETAREVGAGAEEVIMGDAIRSAEREEPAARSYRAISRFYYPLALTSLIGLTVQPLLTFFMGRAPDPVASLAVFPVVLALSFLFRTFGLSFQEAAIALLGRRSEDARQVGRFALGLGVAASGALALIAFTPLARIWFETVSGLPPELVERALVPTQISALLPALAVMLAFQRALLVQERTTGPITVATIVELGCIAAFFPIFGWSLGLTGATAAMLAFLVGRVASVLFLIPRTRLILRRVSLS